MQEPTNTWLVVAHERTGGTAIFQLVADHLLLQGRRVSRGFDNRPTAEVLMQDDIVLHTHTADATFGLPAHVRVVLPLRLPTTATLSKLISLKSGYWHAWRNAKDDVARREEETRAREQPLRVEIDELWKEREVTVRWHEIVVRNLARSRNRVSVIRYEHWNGELARAAEILGLSIPKGYTTSTMMNPRTLLDRVANQEEIKENVIYRAISDDHALLDRWCDALAGHAPA